MPTLHQRLPANATGRDFIIGDLHGCLDLFQAQLEHIGFDPARDRIFSVGDLADRGPDAMGCLRLLREPWFHAVRGNHEAMLLDHVYPVVAPYAYDSPSSLFFRNGGRWVLDLGKSDQDELMDDLVPRVAKLPYVLTVGDGTSRFHVAHAELMTGEVDEVALAWYRRLAGEEKAPPKRVLTDAMLGDAMLATMTEALIWGRRLIREVDPGQVLELATPYGKLESSHKPWREGLALTYVGHTPLTHMVLHASHLFIDRGAYARKPNTCLLMVEHARIQACLAPSRA